MKKTRLLLRLGFVKDLLEDAVDNAEGLTEQQEKALYDASVAVKEAERSVAREIGEWPCKEIFSGTEGMRQ